MENIKTIAELQEAIQLLEIEQTYKGQLVKEQFMLTYESLKPANLLKNTLHDLVSSPLMLDNMLGTVVGLGTGYLTKKIVSGLSGGIFGKLFGSVMQFGVTKFVAQHPDAIKSLGSLVFQYIKQRREHKRS